MILKGGASAHNLYCVSQNMCAVHPDDDGALISVGSATLFPGKHPWPKMKTNQYIIRFRARSSASRQETKEWLLLYVACNAMYCRMF